MLSKRTLAIIALVAIPPTVALGLALAIGWLRFELSPGGILLALSAYVTWIAVLDGLTR